MSNNDELFLNAKDSLQVLINYLQTPKEEEMKKEEE